MCSAFCFWRRYVCGWRTGYVCYGLQCACGLNNNKFSDVQPAVVNCNNLRESSYIPGDGRSMSLNLHKSMDNGLIQPITCEASVKAVLCVCVK
jgi:hypothetical protein